MESINRKLDRLAKQIAAYEARRADELRATLKAARRKAGLMGGIPPNQPGPLAGEAGGPAYPAEFPKALTFDLAARWDEAEMARVMSELGL